MVVNNKTTQLNYHRNFCKVGKFLVISQSFGFKIRSCEEETCSFYLLSVTVIIVIFIKLVTTKVIIMITVCILQIKKVKFVYLF